MDFDTSQEDLGQTSLTASQVRVLCTFKHVSVSPDMLRVGIEGVTNVILDTAFK